MLKTLTQLKQDANSGSLSLELTERYGEPIPEKLKGVRKVIKANTAGLQLENNDKKISYLSVPCANLVEYTDEFLCVYDSGCRDLSEDEKNKLEKWEKISQIPENVEQAKIDVLTDGSSTYWQKKIFFGKEYEYLMGLRSNGKKYHPSLKKVEDQKVKGNVILKYKVIKQG